MVKGVAVGATPLVGMIALMGATFCACARAMFNVVGVAFATSALGMLMVKGFAVGATLFVGMIALIGATF